MGKQVSRKKRIILIVCAAAFVAAAAAVLLGVLLTQLPKDGDKPPQIEYLPKSNKGEIIFAKRVGATRPDGKPVVIARSYDGKAWEAEPDLDNQPAEIECDDQFQCTMKFDGDYETYSVDVPQQLKELTPMHLASRLYMQGGFGAPKDELLKFASTYGDNVGLWIQDQMRLTPTLARSYYRARSNARPGTFDVFPVNKPCDLNTRWRRFLFDSRDKLASSIQISLNTANQRFVVKVNGVVRGETWTLFNKPYPATGYTFPLNVRFCTLTEQLDGAMTLTLANQTVCNLMWSNPAIDFLPNNYVQSLGPNDAVLAPVVGSNSAVILKSRSVSCSSASDGAGHYYIRQSNATYVFDPRIKLYRNTPEEPSIVDSSAAGQCPIVEDVFNNRDQCVRRSTCSGAVSFKSATFTLNDDILRSWFTKSRRYVYYITELRLEDPYNVSPCSSGISRWKRLGKGACASPTALDTTTKATISAALAASSDANPYVRDITLTGANCSPTTATIGAFVDAAGECFQHVHPDLYSVRDFTRWVDIHDGNKDAMAGGNPNPIAKWADSGLTNLKFPSSHVMTRFYDRRGFIPIVGRYGDQIDFLALSSDLQTEEFATVVGALRVDPGSELFIACGSPGETENIPELGYHYNVWNFNSSRETGVSTDALEWPMPGNYDHVPLIENLAMKAPDQLRQRVAWTLANIFVIASADTLNAQYVDAWAIYYDIFTRNAFGNYKDILREVSNHPLMGIYLTYLTNQAYAVYNSYPDENYAREIMQLFSIGLWRLNDDGTQKLDASGNPMETYTNDDIVDFARVWTGFDRRSIRSNLASIFQFGGTPNLVDPMQIKPAWRDRFPKAKLDSGYLGDTYPLCDDMPAQAFLREGARYEYTGTYSVEGDLIDQENITNSGLRGRFAPPTTSALYKALCAPSSTNGACTFPLVVTLTSNLPCTGAQECNAQRVIAVKIVDPVAKIARYYNYVGLPCVRLTLFDQGLTTVRASSRSQCANPAARIAYPMCCNATTGVVVAKAQSECSFANEATDYATNQQRCAALGLTVCTAPLKVGTATNWANTCAASVYAWTNITCTVQVQVYNSGQIGLIDPLAPVYNILKPSSNNIFRVRWDNDAYPVFDGSKCPEGCAFQATPDAAGSCTCNITVTTSTVLGQLYDLNGINADDAVNVIAQKAVIGSVKPSIYDDGTYSTCGSSECTRLNNVVVWLHKDDNGGLSERTIFQLPPVRLGGRVRYLMNKISTVSVSNAFSFRNPPNFLPLLGELSDVGQAWTSDNLWIRRAENEVESLLEHLFEHDNTAVFVCYRLIQHMVTSNPSPRYMKSVVNAFRTGAYGEITFSGKYGDLGAAVYAILIDQEARSPIVEVDRTYGMLKDPLVKLYQFMRTLEYTSTKGREVALWNTDQVFGVQPFTSPTVFGFYLPEYRPDGVIGNAGVVSPQAQIATTPNLVGFFNGITSLVDNGLTSCDGGLGLPQNYGGRTCVASGPHQTADGVLAYASPADVTTEDLVDELNMLLLGGRLASQTRDLFIREYNNIRTNATMAPQALRHLLKLFAVSAEFQATNFNNVTPEPRSFTKAVPSQGRRFKAIIVHNKLGGCDSFSLLVPHSNCPKKDLYAEYVNVRTGAALDKNDLLAINVPAGTQPCNTFGVHSAMSNLTQLYKDGDALFVANVGALVEPASNKTQVNKRTIRLPPSLFAHNIMQRNVQNVYAQMAAANGILGRITDALLESNPPYASGMFSLGGLVKMVQGSTPADYVSPTSGFIRVRGLNKIGTALEEITKYSTESVFSDTYADGLHYALGKTEVLGALLSNTTLSVPFGRSYIDTQFQQVAKLIKLLPDNGVERAVFYTWSSGFDTHPTFDLNPLLAPIDVALGSFVNEMKAQGKWDDVVVMTVSDFGRTLTSNGKGTDHAWGGNYWVAGGSVKGGQVLGKYPEVLTDEGDLILTRGRVVPTTPFEGIWQGVSEWFDVPADQMQKVLPNLNNFGDDVRFSKNEMFK